MTYRRGNLPEGKNFETLLQFISTELEQLERSFTVSEFIRLKKLYAEPSRVYDGLVVYADGTTWDPGSGEGYYGYYGAAWHKLG